ncbi:formate/nitrite transporter family protein [Halococcus sp. IIIV-5B]|uniref:formate/nitrite transporter family protein n=1 Tax=Halococcus sp. IIIV-5B TaxID=2321230 RepID=UPI000E708BD1|nr:formate/nitrite transporter family protein [Halococcus sp. IIIV-5B]RJT05230.1 formate transporter [Halococcus sp. IIIV-5B]
MASRDDPGDDGQVRDAIDRSRSGVPAAGAVVRDRFSADEVFQRIIAAADEEVTSGRRELFFSGLAAGFAITITFLLYSSMTAATDHDPVLSALLYPLGFIYIIIGGYQLYTENTLPPVALTLERLVSLPRLLRHWTIVLAGNLTGGGLGAVALTWGGVFSPAATQAALEHAQHGIDTPAPALFSKAVFAGLIVAGVVWVVYASRDTISRLVVVYLAFLAIPMGDLFHVVVSFTEMLYLVLAGNLELVAGLTQFVIPVLLGNTVGGIVLVTAVNYFQTSAERRDAARFEGAQRQLSVREWLLGGFAGRSYVSMVDTSATVADDGTYRVLVPIGNPRTEAPVVDLACRLASRHDDAVVHVVHIIQTPDTPASYRVADRERIVANSTDRMEPLRELAESYEVATETSTIVSRRSFEEVFDAADRMCADLVVMGWGSDRPWADARTERPLDELTHYHEADFLVLNDRGTDASRVLVPVGDGPSPELSAEVARAYRSSKGSSVTLLRVVDTPADREAGEAFLDEWATEHDLADAERVVEAGDVGPVIRRVVADHSLLVLGATEAGVLSRLVSDSLRFDVVDGVSCSVVIAERSTERSLVERLIGRL